MKRRNSLAPAPSKVLQNINLEPSEIFDIDFNEELNTQFRQHANPSICATLSNDAQAEDDEKLLPDNLKCMEKVFSKDQASLLPPHREGIDIIIEIPPNTLPRVVPMARLSEKEKFEAKKQTEELLQKGWIRKCKSQSPANILFVQKPHSKELIMCMDFRNLNSITKKDKYPSPHIDDILDKLRNAKYYTRLDILSAYNMIRISPDHEWKTAFRTPDGCFE